MLTQKMKKIINYVIELDIDHLETFRGYHGDDVLKIILRDSQVRDSIDNYLDKMGLKHKDDYDISRIRGGAYTIFVGIEDESIFQLK